MMFFESTQMFFVPFKTDFLEILEFFFVVIKDSESKKIVLSSIFNFQLSGVLGFWGFGVLGFWGFGHLLLLSLLQ